MRLTDMHNPWRPKSSRQPSYLHAYAWPFRTHRSSNLPADVHFAVHDQSPAFLREAERQFDVLRFVSPSTFGSSTC